jgi:hypothetical protein
VLRPVAGQPVGQEAVGLQQLHLAPPVVEQVVGQGELPVEQLRPVPLVVEQGPGREAVGLPAVSSQH